MSDYRNSVYDTDSGIINKTLSAAVIGGIAYGGFKAITDHEQFMKQANKAFDWAFPKSVREFTAHESATDRFHSTTAGAGLARQNRMAAEEAYRASKPDVIYNQDALNEFNKNLNIPEQKGSRFSLTNVKDAKEIRDINGNPLHKEINSTISSLEKELGVTVRTKVWDGTTLKIEWNGGGKQEMKFAVKDAKTGAMLSRKGNAITTVSNKYEYIFDEAKNVTGMEMVGHNEGLLKTLRETTRRYAYAAESPTLDSKVRRQLNTIEGKMKGLNVEKAISEADRLAVLSAAHEAFIGTEMNHVTAISDQVMEHRAKQVSPDIYSSAILEEHAPGSTTGYFGTGVSNPDVSVNMPIKGKNRVDKIKRDVDPSLPKYTRDKKGNLIQIQATDADLGHLTKLNYAGSSMQSANNILFAGEFKGIAAVEGYKSESGMKFVGSNNARGSKMYSGVVGWDTREQFYFNKNEKLSLTAPITDSVDIPLTRGMIDDEAATLYEQSKVKLNYSKSQKDVRTKAINSERHAAQNIFEREKKAIGIEQAVANRKQAFRDIKAKYTEPAVYMDEYWSGSKRLEEHFAKGGSLTGDSRTVIGLDKPTLPVRGEVRQASNSALSKRARGDFRLDGRTYAEAQESTRLSRLKALADPNYKSPGFQMVSTLQNDAIKVMIEGDRTRSAVGYFDPNGVGEGARLTEAYQTATGGTKGPQVIANRKLFEKNNPISIMDLASGDMESLIQKGAHSHLSTMQGQIRGTIEAMTTGKNASNLIASDSFTKAVESITGGNAHLSGEMTFLEASMDANHFATQLTNTQQILSTVTEQYWNNAGGGNINLNLMGLSESADVYTQLLTHPSERKLTPTSNPVIQARRSADPIKMSYVGMEIEQLAMGAGQTNAAKFALGRDAAMLHTRPGIANEILSRSNVDVQLMNMQQQLFLGSLPGANQADQKATIERYKAYAKGAGYEQSEIDEFSRMYDHNIIHPEDVKKEMERFAGGATFGDSMRDMKSEIGASDSFLSGRNRLGKMVPAEDGTFRFTGGKDILGGLTHLDGQMTHDEIAAIIHQAYIMPSIKNGSINQMDEKALMEQLPDIIKKQIGFSKAIVDDAYYVQHQAFDMSAINDNPALRKLQDNFEKGFVSPSATKLTEAEMGYRDALSNTTLFSEDIMRDSIKKEISMASWQKDVKGLDDISGVLDAEGHGSKFWRKYKGDLDALNSIEVAERATKINEITEKIIQDQKLRTAEIHELTFGSKTTASLESLQKGDVKAYEARMGKIKGLVEENGIADLLLRDPNIRETSGAAQWGMMDHGGTLRGKSIATGYDFPLLANSDWDGDKFKAMLSYNDAYRGATAEAIGGVQKIAMRDVIQAKKNYLDNMGAMDASRYKQLYGFENVNSAKQFAEHAIKELPIHTAMAAVIQHGMTGAVDVKQFGMQGHLEQQIKKAELIGTQLNEALSWAHTVPSIITEQELIGGKHIQALFETKMKARGTNIVTAFDVIGDIKAGEMREAIIGGGGHVPVISLFAGARAQNGAAGLSQEWEGTNQLMNDFKAMQYNLRAVDEPGAKSFYAAREYAQEYHKLDNVQRSSVDSMWAGYNSRLNEAKAMAAQGDESFLPVAERAWAKDVFDGNIVDLAAKGQKVDSSLASESIWQRAYKASEGAHTNFNPLENEEHMSTLFNNLRQQVAEVSPYDHARGLLGDPHAEGLLPKASRAMKGWDKVIETTKPAREWIAEAPLPRLGGIAAVAMAGVAALNLFSGDGTPQRPGELPRYNNPTFEGSGFHKNVNYDMMSSYTRSNNSNSLLSDNTQGMSAAMSTINAHVNLNGHNSINIREDRSNPYMSDMHNTFNH